MRYFAVWCAAALGGVASLFGCANGPASVAIHGTGSAGPVSQDPDDYRKVRFTEALRGLAFEDGLVRPDIAAARDVVVGRSATDALGAGQALMEENDFSGAAGEFRTAILLTPGEAAGYIGLGDALICKKKDDLALAAYRTAVASDGADIAARMRLAETRNRVGDLDGAAREFAEIITLDPSNGEAHARLAVMRYYQGDLEGARAHAALAEALGGSVPAQLIALIRN